MCYKITDKVDTHNTLGFNSTFFLSLAGCGHDEFVPMYGTVEGYGTIGDMNATIMDKCITQCIQNVKCRSFEWIPSEKKCELNRERIPITNATMGYIFCSRTGECKNRFS